MISRLVPLAVTPRISVASADATDVRGVTAKPPSPGMSVGTSMSVVVEASKQPEVAAAEQGLREASDMLAHTRAALQADATERRVRCPDLFLESTWQVQHQWRRTSLLLSLASYAVAFGVTRIPAVQPYSAFIWGAAILDLVPTVVGSFARRKFPQKIDDGVLRRLKERQEFVQREVEVRRAEKERLLQQALERLTAEALKKEGDKGRGGQVNVEEEFVVVNGVRVPRKAEA